MADFANTPDRLWVRGYGVDGRLDHVVRTGRNLLGLANAQSEAEAYVRDVQGRVAHIVLQSERLADEVVVRKVAAMPHYLRSPTNFFDRCKELEVLLFPLV